MVRSKKPKCVRCESLERPQKGKRIHMVKTISGGEVPMCSACMLEVQEEEDFIKSLREEEEEDEPGGKEFD